MAQPNGRTSHLNPIPNLGGTAIFTSVLISSVIFTGGSAAQELIYILAGMLMLYFVGLKDDLLPIPAWQKLLGQSLAAFFIIVPGSLHLSSLYGLFGIDELSYLGSLAITGILFLTLINSFNLIDGIDGLASGIGILASLFFGFSFLQNGVLAFAIMSFVMTASLLAFYYFNVFGKKNKIFLGDNGSMLVGLLLSIFAVRFLNMENSQLFSHPIQSAPTILLCVFIVPIYDTARVMVVRILQGRSPFEADRMHIHHQVLHLQRSHLKASLTILGINGVFILLPFLFSDIDAEEMILTTLALATLLFHIPVYLNTLHQNHFYEIELPKFDRHQLRKRA
jgi:UDP-GlcNAc:undecaprenyl-phosphate/decaprenyl-phosphate GlcNAc-1-phosphate transferase